MSGTTGHGKYPRECLINSNHPNAKDALYGEGPGNNLANAENIERFQKWVRATGGKHLHYFSLRSFYALHSMRSSVPAWDDGQYFSCMGDINETEETHIREVLATWSLSERYECIIHAENIETELYACMHKYARKIRNGTVRQQFLAKIERTSWVKSIYNPSTHGSCSQYFNVATHEFVWAREGPFASR